MIRHFITFLCFFFLQGCNTNLVSLGKSLNPVIAKRIMVVIMPNEESVYALEGFLSVCDSTFKKAGIAKTAVILNIDDFRNGTNSDKILEKALKNPVKDFLPDCLMMISPNRRKRNSNSISVEYRVSIMPFDITSILAPKPDGGNEVEITPQHIGSFNLYSTGRQERDRKNGVKEANEFILLLKKNISTLH